MHERGHGPATAEPARRERAVEMGDDAQRASERGGGEQAVDVALVVRRGRARKLGGQLVEDAWVEMIARIARAVPLAANHEGHIITQAARGVAEYEA